jgi:hypothetical protein
MLVAVPRFLQSLGHYSYYEHVLSIISSDGADSIDDVDCIGNSMVVLVC